MIDFSTVSAGQKIAYIAPSFAFGGKYTCLPIEKTYVNEEDVPEKDRGKWVIIEFMNDGTPMFFTADMLNPRDWELC
jgi:hypothetical protein